MGPQLASLRTMLVRPSSRAAAAAAAAGSCYFASSPTLLVKSFCFVRLFTMVLGGSRGGGGSTGGVVSVRPGRQHR